MKVLVLCASVLWCLVTAQDSRPYHLHSVPNTRPLQNDPQLDVFLQNQRNPQLHFNSESRRADFSGGRHDAALQTDPARHIIHFPQHASTEDTGSNYKEVSFDRSQFREPASGHNTPGLSGFRNPSQPSGLVNLGDLKNTFHIHNIAQPKVTRTVYINGVKVENDSEANVASIISALLNPHLQNQYTSTAQNEARYDPSYNQPNKPQVPSYILNHLNNYKQDSSGNSNNNQIPQIDVRLGHFGNGKLARLREKGRYVKNATSIYNKREITKK